jgi:hypothetical protein
MAKKANYAKNQKVKTKNIKPEKPVDYGIDRDASKGSFSSIVSPNMPTYNTAFFYELPYGSTSVQVSMKFIETVFPSVAINWEVIEGSVLGLDRIVDYKKGTQGSDELLTFVRWQLSNIKNFDDIIRNILSGIKYGYMVNRLPWQPIIFNNQPKYLLTDIEGWSPEKFRFDEEWNLVLYDMAKYPAGKQVNEEWDFKVATWKEEFGNRYGKSLYAWIWNAFCSSKDAIEYFMLAIKKYAVQGMYATTEDRIDDVDAIANINGFLANGQMGKNVFINGVGVTFGTLDIYDKAGDNFLQFLGWVEKQISLRMTGSIDHVEDTGGGSLARSKVKAKLREDILRAYVSYIETYMNDSIIRTMVDINYPGIDPVNMPKWKMIIKGGKEVTTVENIEVNETGKEKVTSKTVTTKEYE